jgi:hypothetical protein
VADAVAAIAGFARACFQQFQIHSMNVQLVRFIGHRSFLVDILIFAPKSGGHQELMEQSLLFFHNLNERTCKLLCAVLNIHF